MSGGGQLTFFLSWVLASSRNDPNGTSTGRDPLPEPQGGPRKWCIPWTPRSEPMWCREAGGELVLVRQRAAPAGNPVETRCISISCPLSPSTASSPTLLPLSSPSTGIITFHIYTQGEEKKSSSGNRLLWSITQAGVGRPAADLSLSLTPTIKPARANQAQRFSPSCRQSAIIIITGWGKKL